MVNTGITRRIDELGRLVIPKEIRRNLKIKDNDQIEINVIDDKIMLNKYENMNIDKYVVLIINLLRKVINKNILFTSRDKILNYALIKKEKIDDVELNKDIMNIIENRNDVVNINIKDYIYTINPIIINGDLYGSLISYSDEKINDQELAIIKFSKLILENYLE